MISAIKRWLMSNAVKVPTREEVMAMDRPGKGANTGYQKFVILTHARSGSSLMVQLLKSHPEILCFGELFVNKRIGFNQEGFDQNQPELLALRNEQPIRFLKEYVFAGWSDDHQAVGFKLFPDQMDNGAFKLLWEWLEANKDVKIIHLNRNNQLATYASLLKARKTKQFGITSEENRSMAQVEMNPREAQEFFEMRESYRNEIVNRFNDRRLDITYEELDQGMEDAMRKVQAFLGLKVVELQSKKVKQETRPLADVILNYDSLKAELKATPWITYFD